MLDVDVQLRPAEEADDDFLFALHRAALGPVIEATWGPWDDAAQRAFNKAWFKEPARLSVVLADGQPSASSTPRSSPATCSTSPALNCCRQFRGAGWDRR